ncbi:MAG TPA: M48 family metallopeptidase, partial [Candidatus Binatia bacterium]|nr:M48 family metallopeptidase [Candidatus Binatia bacterium]
ISTDEGGLWGMSDRAESVARSSGQLESDPALNAYVQDVACQVANEFCGDIRLYIMNRPYFNASMAPNGYMEVWSGLLLRAEDEAQLAFVLGHEVGHYQERHSVEMQRTLRNRATAAAVFSIITAGVGVGIVGDIVYLGTIASVFGFSRENELESDSLGYAHATRAGYDPNAGHLLWNNLIAETRASDNPDVRRQETRASIFRTHPLSTDRVEALTERAQAASAGETHRERYRAAIRPHLDEWLRDDLRRRDYGQTALVLDRLAKHGEDLGVVEYYRGEINRIRRADGDRERAIQHYTNAIAQPDAPAAAWRELGEYAERDGRPSDARAFFTTYLERAPQAGDRAFIEARIAQMSGGGQ